MTFMADYIPTSIYRSRGVLKWHVDELNRVLFSDFIRKTTLTNLTAALVYLPRTITTQCRRIESNFGETRWEKLSFVKKTPLNGSLAVYRVSGETMQKFRIWIRPRRIEARKNIILRWLSRELKGQQWFENCSAHETKPDVQQCAELNGTIRLLFSTHHNYIIARLRITHPLTSQMSFFSVFGCGFVSKHTAVSSLANKFLYTRC